MRVYLDKTDKSDTIEPDTAPTSRALVSSDPHERKKENSISRLCILSPFIPLSVLGLDSREAKQPADAALEGVPLEEVDVLVPREEADPGLGVVVEAQADVVEVGELARGVGDVVLWALVLEAEEAAGGWC